MLDLSLSLGREGALMAEKRETRSNTYISNSGSALILKNENPRQDMSG